MKRAVWFRSVSQDFNRDASHAFEAELEDARRSHAQENERRPTWYFRVQPLTTEEVQTAFAAPAVVPLILSLSEAAEMVKLRPQTLKRKVSDAHASKKRVEGGGRSPTPALAAEDVVHPAKERRRVRLCDGFGRELSRTENVLAVYKRPYNPDRPVSV